jgi:hypothetical protein
MRQLLFKYVEVRTYRHVGQFLGIGTLSASLHSERKFHVVVLVGVVVVVIFVLS